MNKKYFGLILVLLAMLWCSSTVLAAENEGVTVKEYNISENFYADGNEYVSEEIKLNQPVWMAGLKITVSDIVGLQAKVRSKLENDWSDWIEFDTNEEDFAGGVLFLDPVALDDKSDVLEYSLSGNLREVKEVEIVGLDPYDYSGKTLMAQKYQKADSLNIINRDEWGADESIMFWDDDMEHAKVKEIVIHHTAGNDNSPLDPAAVVRGIYYYHTVTKGWGDVGYNFLIDQYGNVYEGRKGGLGTVAAHAYGYNTGSVGISVIGNYETTPPSNMAIDGLENVLSYISFQTGVDLMGKTVINGTTEEVVSGHRDVDQTACPGKVFYDLLPQIRKEADALSNKSGVRQIEARFIDLSTNYISLDDGETKNIEVKYLNTGTGAWLNGNRDIELVTTSPKQRASKFMGSDWESSSVVGEAFRYSIMPNDYATWKFDLKGNKEKGVVTESFALMSQGKILDGTSFTIVVDNSGNEFKEKVSNFHGISPKYYRYEVMENPVINIVEGEKAVIELELKNTGDNNWDKSGLFPIHLATSNARDHDSIFYNSSDWLTSNRLQLQQEQVKPGEVGLFKFSLPEKLKIGSYLEDYGLVLENISWIDGEELKLMVNVDAAKYDAEILGKSGSVPYMLAGEVVSLWVDVRNSGNQTWYKTGDNKMQLGTSSSHDRSSDFYNKDYWQANNRPEEMKVESVAPGEVVRLEVLMQAPVKTGNYHECFTPVIGGKKWLDKSEVCWDIMVSK